MFCAEFLCKQAKKHMPRWTGRRDITEQLMKTALIIQSNGLNRIETFLHLFVNSVETD